MIFATIAPPGSSNIPLKIGAITIVIACIASLAAWTARETHRVRLHDLGEPGTAPVDKEEYERLRAQSPLSAGFARS
jgi:hypothetical protein